LGHHSNATHSLGHETDEEQAHIDRLGVVISNKDKLQFYMEQIYASNCFDKKEMVGWENKPVNIKIKQQSKTVCRRFSLSFRNLHSKQRQQLRQEGR
jgi:hypothetical protein